MASFDIAHINEQGVDLILIPLDKSFGNKTAQEQNAIIDSLQICSTQAGLRGTVIPVWLDTLNRMNFIAPNNYHPFLRSIDFHFVQRNINKRLTCS